MAGLLDSGFLSTPDAQLGLGLLAMGGGNFGNAIGGLLQQQAAMEERKAQREERALRQRLGSAQLANYQSEIDNRALAAKKDARQQDLIAQAMQGGGQDGQGIMGLAQQFGIAPQVLQADIAFNSGKKIAELLSERSKPNWQNIGGNLVNTNDPGFKGGFQDQIQIGPNGQAIGVFRNQNGQLMTGALPGSLPTYQAFQDISNRSSASLSPGRPVLDAEGRQRGQSQLQEIGMAPPPMGVQGMQPGMQGRAGPTNAAEQGMAAQVAGINIDPQREIAQVEMELRSITNPQDRAAALAYLQRLQSQGGRQQTAMAPTSASSPAGALDFSPAEKAAQEAARIRAVDTAKADVVRDTGQKTDAKRSGQFVQSIDRAIELLNQGPTSSLVGMGVDKLLGAGGMSTKGADIGAQLGALSGWLTSNVPRMEGPQSDRDAANYATMAGMVGDNSQPISKRLAAAREVKNLQMKYASLNGIEVPGQGGNSASQQPAANRMVFDSKPPANQSNKGKLLVGPDGKRYRSNGMQWTEE